MLTLGLGSSTHASPAVAPDGTVYIGADDKYVYAISRDGHLKWRYLAPGFVESSAAIAADGSVYVGYYKGGQGGLLQFTATNWNPSFKRTTHNHRQEFFRLQGPSE